jgi:hypothetical protein
MTLPVEAMRRHVEQLLEPYTRLELSYRQGRYCWTQRVRVVWIRRVRKACVFAFVGTNVFEIQIAPIKSSISYLAALHEIGHIKDPSYSQSDRQERERFAWDWARRNALTWTPAIERLVAEVLAIRAKRGEDRIAATMRRVGAAWTRKNWPGAAVNLARQGRSYSPTSRMCVETNCR